MSQSCKERIDSHYESRIEDLKTLWEADCNGEENEELGNLFEYGLCFDYVEPNTFNDQKQGYWRYQISYGGPSEEFRFYVNEDHSPYKIEFWFLDWFDGAPKTLTGADFELLENIYNLFRGL